MSSFSRSTLSPLTGSTPPLTKSARGLPEISTVSRLDGASRSTLISISEVPSASAVRPGAKPPGERGNRLARSITRSSASTVPVTSMVSVLVTVAPGQARKATPGGGRPSSQPIAFRRRASV